MTIDWSGCLICDLLHEVAKAFHEADSNRIAARRLRRFSLKGLNTSHMEAAENRAADLETDLDILQRHPCKGSYRLKG
jgi:hypothetical protein